MGESLSGALDVVLACERELVGAITSLESLSAWVEAHRPLIDCNPAARWAIERAILDLLGKQAALSVEALLGVPALTGQFRYTAVVFDSSLATFQVVPNGWGSTRIRGALSNLRHHVGRCTIRRILLENGIEPSPLRRRRTPWSVIRKAHWRALVATNFLTVEVWSWRGLVTHYILFFIEVASRKVLIAGMPINPDESWTLQVVRNQLDNGAGLLDTGRVLIMDRDTKFSATFRGRLA